MQTDDRSPFERLKDAVKGHISESGDGWHTAHCPAHEDANPSFRFRETKEGGVALKCFAGCSREKIISALDFDGWEDLYRDCNADWKPWDGDLVARYTYKDEDGIPVFQVVRYEMRDPSHPAYGEKKFLQHAYIPDHPDAGRHDCDTGYISGRSKHGVEVCLYNLARVGQAVRYGDAVYWTEGEKDVETIGNMGLVGTTLPQGASNDPTIPDHIIEPLKGADVVLLPDHDPVGRAYMDAVANQLAPITSSVKVVSLPGLRAKEDITDWVKHHGGTRADLAELVEATDKYEWVPRTAEELVAYCEGGGVPPDVVYAHIEVLAQASATDLPGLKRRLKKATGINLNDLRSALKTAKDRIERERAEKERLETLEELAGGAPVVRLNGRRSVDVVDDICQALESANGEADVPIIFRRSEIVEVVEAEGGPEIVPMDEAAIDDMIGRYVCCVVEEEKAKGPPSPPKPRDPTIRIVRRVAYRADLPKLNGLSEVPIMRPDGTIQDRPGYDEETRLLYTPSTEPIRIPEDPGPSAVRDALALLSEVWTDHPFTDTASEAGAFALAMTPIVLPMMDGANAPLGIISAREQGTGKTMLAESAGTLGTGRRPPVIGAPEGEAEWRKQITALLRKGTRVGIIDDVSGTLDSGPLRRALTSATISDRVLGASTQVRLPANTVWCATGNNLRPSGDMVRRCYLIQLDAEMQRPWHRRGFTHRQPEWTIKNRARLAAAALTLARAWVIAGRPSPPDTVPQMGSFEEWRETIGGILHHAGVSGFLTNLDVLNESVFVEDDGWGRLLEAVADWQPDQGFTVRHLARTIGEQMRMQDMMRDDAVMEIVEWLPDKIRQKVVRRDPIAKALGRSFGYRKGRIFTGGWRLVTSQSSNVGTVWKVEKKPSGTTRTRATPSTLNEGGGGGPDTPDPESQSKVSNSGKKWSEEAPF